MTRESMEYDVVIVGGGPSGLAAAIRVKQLAAAGGRDVSVCLLEKGSEIGAHILSGAVIDPRGLTELVPDWKAEGAPLDTPVVEDRFLILTADKAYRIPNWALPRLMDNHGNYVASLGNLCKWLATKAEALGVEIYPGFAAAEVLVDERGAVTGVATGDMGIAKDGSHKPEYQPGMELHAKYTLFAEGCRGSLSQTLMKRYNLRDGVDPQKYGIGLKELWQVEPSRHRKGLVVHSQGWPLDSATGGGSFVYHYGDNLVACGFVVHLNYDESAPVAVRRVPALQDPPGDPRHVRGRQAPRVRRARDQRRRPAVGAEARVSRRRADRLRRGLRQPAAHQGLAQRDQDRDARRRGGVRGGRGRPRARHARRLRQGVARFVGLRGPVEGAQRQARPQVGHVAGLAAWRRPHVGERPGPRQAPALDAPPRQARSRVAEARVRVAAHRVSEVRRRADLRQALVGVPVEHQPRGGPAVAPHAQGPGDPGRGQPRGLRRPRAALLPAGVYEFVDDGAGARRLQINAQNCVHCKTCDIKDPKQNIVWVVPEGGGGPNYPGM
jgi:electron-transferring-flavoprotein dehydrogenase